MNNFEYNNMYKKKNTTYKFTYISVNDKCRLSWAEHRDFYQQSLLCVRLRMIGLYTYSITYTYAFGSLLNDQATCICLIMYLITSWISDTLSPCILSPSHSISPGLLSHPPPFHLRTIHTLPSLGLFLLSSA